ncbi:MAG: 3-methyladenine DNA glycosylase [Anaerolineae bacterium]|jgi:3-methyladenine DNA glycosylase/8-oxoguanine DNA glycosylase
MGGVNVEVRERLTGSEREEASRKVWWMLGLGEDLSPFYAAIEEEPELRHVRRQAMGRILRSPTVFEDVIKTILTTNTSWAGTIRMVEALVTEYGDPLPTDPSRHAFPTPAQIAGASEQDLRHIGLGYRAPFILTVAQRTMTGDLKLETFKKSAMPTTEIHRRLLEIKGIGEYAAASLLMLLGRFDYVPVDSWARNMVSREWHGGETVGREEVEQAFERWGAWKGLVYWFWNWSHQG